MTDQRSITKRNKSHFVYLCLGLIVLMLIAYWGVKDNGFIQFDDPQYVTINTYVKRGINCDSIRWAFGTLHINAFYWHPITWLSHMLDCQLFGLDARWHHVTGLMIHIINTLLLFFLLIYMTGRIWPSAFVAALFALHPLHVESVAWVAERKDLLSGFFWISASIAYVWYGQHPNFKRYVTVLVLFALGLMSKPMVVTLPFVWLLLDYWPLVRISQLPSEKATQPAVSLYPPKRTISSLVIEKIPFFILSATISVLTWIAQEAVGALKSVETFPISIRLANSIHSYVFYISKLLIPHDLAIVYPFTLSAISGTRTILYGLILLAATLFVLFYSKKYRYLFVGWFWYLGTLIPVIGLAQVGWQASADRFTYIPLIGLFIIIAWGIPDLFRKWASKTFLLGALAGATIILLGICTAKQVHYWKNTQTVFTHAARVTKDNYIAYTALATVSGDSRQSYALLKKSLALRPDYYYAHCHLGIVYAAWDDLEKAIYHYKEALRLNPNYSFAHYSLAEVYRMQKRYSEALDHFTRALHYRLKWDSPIDNLISLLLNHKSQAFKHLSKTIEDLEAMKAEGRATPKRLFALSVAYYRMGRYKDAMSMAESAERLAVSKNDRELATFIQEHKKRFHQPMIEPTQPRSRDIAPSRKHAHYHAVPSADHQIVALSGFFRVRV